MKMKFNKNVPLLLKLDNILIVFLFNLKLFMEVLNKKNILNKNYHVIILLNYKLSLNK